ncbi:MAG: WD40/YVTN/BNR-like repeat-containing protein, partial [Candidatus Sericytochromatia bacterium]
FWEPTGKIEEVEVKSLGSNSKGDIFACTSSGLFKNSGDKWEKISSLKETPLKIKIDSKDNIYILTKNNSILVSYNNGDSFFKFYSQPSHEISGSWNKIKDFEISTNSNLLILENFSDQGSNNDYLVSINKNRKVIQNSLIGNDVISISSINEKEIFVIKQEEGYSRPIIKYSNDEGKTWKEIPINIKLPDDIEENVSQVYISKNKDFYFLVPNYGLFLSTDLGKTWKNIYKVKNESEISFSFFDDDISIYDTSLEYSQISKDKGKSWEKIQLNLSRFSSYLKIKDKVFIGTSSGVMYSANLNTNLTELNKGFEGGRIEKLISDSKNTVYILTMGNKLYKSIDDGSNWINLDSLLPKLGSNIYVNSINLENYELYIYYNNESIFKSKDEGLTWEKSKAPEYKYNENDDRDKIVLDNGERYIYNSDNLFLSTDNNKSQIITEIDMFNKKYTSGKIRFLKNKTVYKSDDNGKTWLKDNNIIQNKNIEDEFSIIDNNFFYSTQKTKNRVTNISGLPNGKEQYFTLFKTNKHLFINTNNGLYRTSDSIDQIKKEYDNNDIQNTLSFNRINTLNGGILKKVFDIGKGNLLAITSKDKT